MYNDDKNILSAYQKEYERVHMSEGAYNKMRLKMEQGRKEKEIEKRRHIWKRTAISIVAAASLALVILPNTSHHIAHAMSGIPVLGKLVDIVTIREYQYEDETQSADITVPQITISGPAAATDETASIQKSSDQINAEIQKLSDQWIKKFKQNQKKNGYQHMSVTSEVVATTDQYFTLKLICYESSASGYEENHYYTIDLKTGKKIKLKDLFVKGSQFRHIIRENIEQQMRERTKADNNAMYWLDDVNMEDWSLSAAIKQASFYVNGSGEVVISFNEGEAAPMYMGIVEFVIPNEVLQHIRTD